MRGRPDQRHFVDRDFRFDGLVCALKLEAHAQQLHAAHSQRAAVLGHGRNHVSHPEAHPHAGANRGNLRGACLCTPFRHDCLTLRLSPRRLPDQRGQVNAHGLYGVLVVPLLVLLAVGDLYLPWVEVS